MEKMSLAEGTESFCQNGGGPPINSDISGIGVRVSFYLQTLFLAVLCTRSESLDEIVGSMYTLLSTNMAMAVTGLILGLKPTPEISLHDALIVFYLLYLSWTTVVFSLPSCNRLPGSTKVVKTVSVIQSYTLFAFALALIILAPKFGNHPECNRNAVLVLFRPFKVFNAGRILGFISIGLVVLMYTVMTILDYIPQDKKDRARKMLVQRMTAKFMHLGSAEEWPADRESPNPERPEQPEQFEAPSAYQSEPRPIHHLNFSGELFLELLVILVLWAIAVMNTELLIRWNHFANDSNPQSIWQFGQVLPLFLLVLPIASTFNAFGKLGLRHRPLQRRIRKKGTQ